MISVVDERKALLAEWLNAQNLLNEEKLSVASADASFRRYFRLQNRETSYIAMDAPPDLEESLPFVEIGKWMKNSGINVPEIIAKDLDLGFLVLSDFGDFHFQDAICDNDKDMLYSLASKQIIHMQTRLLGSQNRLPLFDKSWQMKELDIFREWCLPGISVDEYQKVLEPLISEVDAIPKAFMHRDFHCRNLLVYDESKIGIIDFQGAMYGPITYDLVSLLRDCYVDNDPEWIDQMVKDFLNQSCSLNSEYIDMAENEFIRWFDLAGLQRHLKCVGIFHRLKIRDNKPEYLKDVPRVLGYIEQVLERNSELKKIQELINEAEILN